MYEGLLEGVTLNLETRFGRDGAKLVRQVRAMDVDGMRKFVRFLKKAKTVEQVRDYFA